METDFDSIRIEQKFSSWKEILRDEIGELTHIVLSLKSYRLILEKGTD